MDRLKKKLANITSGKKNKQTHIQSQSAHALASACAAFLPSLDSIKLSGQSIGHVIQSFQVVWLDTITDEVHNHSCRNTITILRHIVNAVNRFIEFNECIDFIRNVKEEKILMIISGTLGHTMIPMIHDRPQVHCIYIFYENKLEHELWTHKWRKVRGVFMDVSFLCEALRQSAYECDQNTVPLSFIETSDMTLDQSFIHTQVLKEIVLSINFKQQDINEFLTYYRKLIIGNIAELRNVDKFEREYHDHGPIWWYTYQCFLYSLLNHALCTMNIDTIIKLGFFIRDLHQSIVQLYHQQYVGQYNLSSFIVYHGQGISQTNFDHLKKTQNGILSFNSFLFTSKNRYVSLDFARQTAATSDLVGILFVMTINPSTASTPFANIRDSISSYPTDKDILFSIQSIFRVGQIKQIDHNNKRLWQVELTLINDNDPELHVLTERIPEKTFPHRKGWCRLSELLIKDGQFSKAQQLCDTVLTQTSDDAEKGLLYYQLGLIKSHQGEYLEANSFYNLSLQTLPPEHIDMAVCYNEMGLAYEKLNEYSKAISSLEKALDIYQKTLPDNDSILTNCNNNIGGMYFQNGEYSKSLFYHQKVLEIQQNTLPANHLDTANSYNSIGLVYEKMGEYPKAISSFEKTLAIRKKNLPSNHSDIADSYHNIGSVYEKTGEYTITISYYEKSLEIYEEILPADHPDLAVFYNNIGLVYFQRGDHLKALSCHEKAQDIYRKILPPNHPLLAVSYVCQGAVYEGMGKFTKALFYYKKAFQIYRNNHNLNPLDLAAFYHAIGSVCIHIEEYSTALSCYEKGLEIYQKNLPPDHPDLVSSYIWHGDLYEKMGDHLKACSFYESALDIGKHSLPDNHPCLQQWKDNLEMIKKKL